MIRGPSPIVAAEQKPKLSTLRRFLQYFAPYRQEIPIALLLVMLGATTQSIGPLLIGWAIDNLILQGNWSGLARLLALLVVIYVLGVVAIRGQIWRIGNMMQRVLGATEARFVYESAEPSGQLF